MMWDFCINRVTPVAGWFMMDNRILYSHTVFFTPVPDLYGNHQIAWLMCQYDNYTYVLYTVYYIQMMYILIITRTKVSLLWFNGVAGQWKEHPRTGWETFHNRRPPPSR